MDELRVRAYNVRFGDAILVSVPDRDGGRTVMRHILIDVGNVLSGEGGADEVFKPALEGIIRELDGRPVDLYVMTHEHMDHVQGLFYADAKLYGGKLDEKLKVDYAWLTGSAAEGYYDTHPEAKKKKLELAAAHAAIERFLAAAEVAQNDPLRMVLANNNPRSTEECVAFLRKLARKKTTYVHRGIDLRGKHPFKEARFHIWAPEEDTADYYGRLDPMALGAAAGGPAVAGAAAPVDPHAGLVPPPGVDAGSFFDLVDRRAAGLGENLFQIDKAANNTSVVFALEWRGWKLLFTGDAELRSWATMKAKGVLEPIDFIKVSHHGSHNGTPDNGTLEMILPGKQKGSRVALASTYAHTYPGIPHSPTDAKLKARATLVKTSDKPAEDYVEWTFPERT